jgi:hypothetical protein
MLSDFIMVKHYFDTGLSGTARGLLVMVGGNLLFQAIVVYLQSQGLKKDKWRKMLLEILAVVTFLKPGLEAHRVASGAEQVPGAPLSPLAEMIYTKAGELFFEAVPGLVLQLATLTVVKEKKTTAVMSAVISAASAAFTATTLFWDADTDPGARKRNPKW